MAWNPPSDNVWIGDLPADIEQNKLREIFGAYGTVVDCRVLAAKPGGKPCAMVRFGSLEEATFIVDTLNGNFPQGLSEPIIARYANAPGSKPDPSKGKSFGKGGGNDSWQQPGPYGGGKGKGGGDDWNPPPSDNLWIGDLPADIEQHKLCEIFGSYGTIVDCRVLAAKPGGKPCAMVRFGSVEEATWIVENLNGNFPQGLSEPIVARYANAPGSKSDPSKGKSFGKGDWNSGGSDWNSGGKCGVWYSGKDGGWNSGGKDGVCNGGGGDFGGKTSGKGKKGCASSSFDSLYMFAKKSGVLPGAGTVPQECTAYIKNLPPDTTDLGLYKLFTPFGAIALTGVKAMLHDDGTCKGFGFIDFVEADCAGGAVLSLDGMTLPDGSSIGVSRKLPSLNSKGGGGGAGSWESKGKSNGGGTWEKQEQSKPEAACEDSSQKDEQDDGNIDWTLNGMLA